LKKATLHTDNLIKSRFAFRFWREKKIGFCFSKQANFPSLRTAKSASKNSQ
jgi:hypothetical protein